MINWLKEITRLVVVSDTFVEFADPLMKQLGRPILFCHSLTVDEDNNITGYNLRQKDPKKKVIQALKSLKYEVIAFGDSYNDISMLKEADKAILPVANEYKELKIILNSYLNS